MTTAQPAGDGDGLVGREDQVKAIEEAFAGLPTTGGAMLLHGDPGIGKSVLLEVAKAEAEQRGLTVLSAVGVQSESDIPFAGLHQLLRPVLERAGELPARQQNALLTAMGAVAGPAPERFLIALAALEILAAVAADRAVLIAVEDLHWLDPASADVLAFVARRIESEPLLLIAASRQGPERWPGDSSAHALEIPPLSASASQRLLDRSAISDGALQQRLLYLSAGNPLALVELPQNASRAWLAGDSPEQVVPLTRRLEQSFAARTAGLPESTRAVLLVAAIEDNLRPAEAFEAAGALLPSAERFDVRPAVHAGLVVEGERGLRFLHPLMRSAVQLEAGPEACRSAHAALGEILAATPARSIWHRAATCLGRDDSLAAELVESADVALARGALSDAARRLE